jgi:integrase
VTIKRASAPEENLVSLSVASEDTQKSVPLPETISVKYTEEEAEYLSVRPLVRQVFRSTELVDMVVSVAGKDLARVQKILGSGTIVFHSFRYWWTGFEADSAALREILEKYPDADPSRAFRAEDCTEVILESNGSSVGACSPPRHSLRIRREEANKRRLLRSRSFWETLMNVARDASPAYREYSYSLRGDIYVLVLSPEQIARLARDAARSAPRGLRADLAVLSAIAQLVFVCPRLAAESARVPI